MSDQNDDAPPQQPPDEPPPSSPFPESSLTPPPREEPPAAPLPPSLGIPAPPPPAVPDPLAPAPPLPWMETPPPPPAAPEFPPGYTSPPPPGAGFPAPAPPAPGAAGALAPGTHVLAGWWRRVGAAIIDGLVLLVPFLLILSALGLGFFGDDEGAADGFVGFMASLFLMVLVFIVVALLYAPLMMASTNGKTLGRMATGIRVIRAGGERITFGFAAVREIAVKGLLVGFIATVTVGIVWLIDVLWPLWDDENRALHDFVVNTRTVLD